MTRYTKLERKPIAHESSDFFGDKQKAKKEDHDQEQDQGQGKVKPKPKPLEQTQPIKTVFNSNSNPEPEPGSDSKSNTTTEKTSDSFSQNEKKKPRKRKRGNKGTESTSEQDPSSSSPKVKPIAPAPAPTEPSGMLKRAKLLRLKAKKAKGQNAVQRKNAWLMEAAKWEREASKANGERGGKVKASGNKTEKDPMAGVEVREGENPWKAMERARRTGTSSSLTNSSTDKRREKRMQERNSSTICFACRGMGHSAKDCQSNLNSQTTALEDPSTSSLAGLGEEGEMEKKKLKGSETVGICFRCGSDQHSLAKCRRPTPRVGPELPFATCFVCEEKGHLSSKCPKNSTRGVYPMGGCCKLCSSIDHLAKDCELRKENSVKLGNKALEMGSLVGETDPSNNLGADEDDFHHLVRKKNLVEKEVLENQTEQKKAKKIQKGKRRRDDDNEEEDGYADGTKGDAKRGRKENGKSSAKVVAF